MLGRYGREILAFEATLALLVVLLLHQSLLFGRVLSPSDFLLATRALGGRAAETYEPANRLLTDPALQFEPWLEFNRTMLRSGRIPLWNPYAGCGAPHLANGQSGVFDPFNLIAYIGPSLPGALAWIAASRLFVAGLGTFLLAWAWGLGTWGRWFAGLTLPFTGFLVGWLLYPVASAAAWLPWILWATERLAVRPDARRAAILALVVAATLLAGHVQTSAHVLLAGLAYALWRLSRAEDNRWKRVASVWCGGVGLGIALAAVQIVPLGGYLMRSPVWADREAARPPILGLGSPRWLDAVTTALPYAFGSQRRGQPNLAPAVGVDNINEAAGGFAGLVALLWLAPLGWALRGKWPVAGFLAGFGFIGALGSFDVPPVSTILRAIPVLNVMDHRRLGVWVALATIGLAAIGLDGMTSGRLPATPGIWLRRAWAFGAACLVAGGVMVVAAEPRIRAVATAHYQEAVASNRLDASRAPILVERQVRNTVTFLPHYAWIIAAQLGLMWATARAVDRGYVRIRTLRGGLLALALVELLSAAAGRNPAIASDEWRPESEVTSYLRRELPAAGRTIGVGDELPPNVLMRYGLADARNYDSVELTANLDLLEPIYEPSASRTSRRTITWETAARGRHALEAAGVCAIVGASPPPAGLFERVDRVAQVWIARIDPAPAWPGRWLDQGPHTLTLEPEGPSQIVVATTYDPGWVSWGHDGRPREVRPDRFGRLVVSASPGDRQISLAYRPLEFRVGALLSMSALVLVSVCWFVPLVVEVRLRKNPNGTWKPRTRPVRIDGVAPKVPAPGPFSSTGSASHGSLHV
jgi:hypothetical protein